MSNAQAIEALRWKKYQCLDDGFICLVDVMGSDDSIVQAARISYGAGTKKVSEDSALIHYLMRHRHTTPFEMCEVKFLVRCPMDTWRQWIRHRTANVNEYSTRYSEAIDSAAVTLPDRWRSQSKDNKQGSGGFVSAWPEKWRSQDPSEFHPPHGPVNTERSNCKTVGDYLSYREEHLHQLAREVYDERIEAGVAREQARKDLPLSTYTEAYWKCDLHNIFNFLRLRCDSHAQLEIRTYADAMLDIVGQLFPLATAAFREYQLYGMTLSWSEIQIIARYMDVLKHSLHTERTAEQGGTLWEKFPERFQNEKSRERQECVEKMKRLGMFRTQLP